MNETICEHNEHPSCCVECLSVKPGIGREQPAQNTSPNKVTSVTHRKNATVHLPTEQIHQQGSRQYKGSTIRFGNKRSRGIMQRYNAGQRGQGSERKRVIG